MLQKNISVIPFLLVTFSFVKCGDHNALLREFDSSPENVSAIAGTTAILTCTVDLSDADAKREAYMSLKKAAQEKALSNHPRFKNTDSVNFAFPHTWC